MLSQQLASWQATRNGQNPETSTQQLSALQAQLAALKSKYTDDHPDVVKLKGDIESLKAKIASEDDQKSVATPEKPARPATEPAQVQALRAQIHQYENTIKEM